MYISKLLKCFPKVILPFMELVTFHSTITLIQDHKMITGKGQEEFNPGKKNPQITNNQKYINIHYFKCGI